MTSWTEVFRAKSRWGTTVALLTAGACAGTGTGAGSGVGASDSNVLGSSSTSTAGGSGGFDASLGGGSDSGVVNPSSVVIAPANPTVAVNIDANGVVTTQSVQFTATSGGNPVNVGWSVDQGGLATISSTGSFTATGASGGTLHVIAGVGQALVSTTVTIVVTRVQNGFTGTIDLTGAGGYGGVGGEGPGPNPGDTAIATLKQTPTADSARTWLYPYDGTVWPRGLLAPLLQWTQGAADATALAIHLQSKTYVYDGYFARPAALASTAPFVRHPIPQDVWQQATESTAGTDALAVSLVFLAGGSAVGPLSATWKVAPGILQGTVYYESYGTLLVTNSDTTASDGKYYGAAVLGIQPGATSPVVVAGTNTASGQPAGTGCRGCHSVAARGSRLVTQDGTCTGSNPSSCGWNYQQASAYNLQTPAETIVTMPATSPTTIDLGPFFYAGLSPDGQYALTNATNLSGYLNYTQLYQLSAGGAATELTTQGLPAPNAASQVQGATPAFSPDGKHVAMTHEAGTLGSLTGDGSHVVTMDFDPTVPSLANAKNVFSRPSSSDCLGFPSFMPTNDSLLVQLQLDPCLGSNTFGPSYVGTYKVHGEVWWTDVATATQHRLDALNGYRSDGSSYLPTNSTHTDDTKLNYEPTVNPAASGGYAWVVFTSRRLYGSVATIDPTMSDPRQYSYRTQVTTKKLWVAAIDLNATPGTDPSHPAFYLPAQELQAGNARGYWVLDPCRADGASCQSGDQCCGGYCQALGDGGSLICESKTTTCSLIGDKCTTASDCCDSTAQCIGGFCAFPSPPPPR